MQSQTRLRQLRSKHAGQGKAHIMQVAVDGVQLLPLVLQLRQRVGCQLLRALCRLQGQQNAWHSK